MRGRDERGDGLFSYVDLEARVPADHPLRAIRVLVDEALAVLSPDFELLYSKTGRPSIAPEKLLRALLLQTFYTIRSERQLMEQLDYNLMFRWFVGLSVDAPVWDATVYSKNRDRLVAGDVAARFLQAVLRGARVRRLLSDEHFSVDGTLIEAWASMKSFRRKDDGGDPPAGRNAERDFRGERRSNATHASTTDADARLFRKGEGQSSRLCFMGHCMNASRDARFDFGVTVGQIAALYPAFRCGTKCPLALMVSADPRLISAVGFSPHGPCRLGGSRSDLFAITPCRALRNLSAATSSVGSSSRCQPWLGRLADEVRLVRPVMGQQGPDCARRLIRQRDGGDVGRPPFGQSHRPFRRRLGVGEHGAGSVDQQGPQIPVPALGDAKYANSPSSAVVPRHQAKPGGELPARPEGCGIAHRGHGGRRGQHADAGDLGDRDCPISCVSECCGSKTLYWRTCDDDIET